MRAFGRGLWRFLNGLPLALLSPVFVLLAAVGLGIADLISLLLGKKAVDKITCPTRACASVVIPNWNGKDLLAKYLPSVIEACSDSEVMVVDNGSTDGSVEFLSEKFPRVRVLALGRNLGFGGGSNAGFRAAKGDVVVLLNSDMRVEPDFLAPLLSAFTDDKVFAVSCQIFFRIHKRSARRRADRRLVGTGRPAGAAPHRSRDSRLVSMLLRRRGIVRVRSPKVSRTGRFRLPAGAVLFGRHRPGIHGVEARLEGALPTGESGISRTSRNHWEAVQRRVHSASAEEELPAVHLEEHPFVAQAGATFFLQLGAGFVELGWRRFAGTRESGGARVGDAAVAARDGFEVASEAAGGGDGPGGVSKAVRWVFRDEFELAEPGGSARTRRSAYTTLSGPGGAATGVRLHVLFVSPYPICPPVHGGGVFMYQTVHELASWWNFT
jgi:hypothetical protein